MIAMLTLVVDDTWNSGKISPKGEDSRPRHTWRYCAHPGTPECAQASAGTHGIVCTLTHAHMLQRILQVSLTRPVMVVVSWAGRWGEGVEGREERGGESWGPCGWRGWAAFGDLRWCSSPSCLSENSSLSLAS